MKFRRDGSSKVVVTTNEKTIAVLEAAGWVHVTPEEAAPQEPKRKPGRPKKSE